MASPIKVSSYRKRIESLKSERSDFVPLWRELSDHHLAHRGRFLVTDRNKGKKRNTKQLNNTSRLANRTMAAGMMAGITSPARPWFRLSMPDRKLMEYSPVKTWLMQVEGLMREVYNKSNLYNSLHTIYSELGTFGIASLGVFSDFNTVIRFKPHTVGSYMIATDGLDKVDTWAREYQMTVGQLVKQFGKEAVSLSVRQRWESGDTEGWVSVCHVIEPNDDRDSQSPLAIDKKFRSIYFEEDSKGADAQVLHQSGFDSFPILTPRWDIAGEDIYGTSCPGMDALGDVKGLQEAVRKYAMAVDSQIDPAVQVPTSLRNHGRILPGDRVPHDGPTKIEAIHSVNPNLQAMQGYITNIEQRISRTWYEDLFLMLANSNRSQITAREVAERHEEELLMLGPVLERLHNELLDPLINRTFDIMQEAGILPPAPPELQGIDLRVEYISVLAQAQRMVATSGVEQLAGFVGQLSQIWPEVRHKFDPAQAIDDYAAALGTAPDIVKADDEYEEALESEAQQAAEASKAEQTMQGIQAAQQLARTPIDENSGLAEVARMTEGGSV